MPARLEEVELRECPARYPPEQSRETESDKPRTPDTALPDQKYQARKAETEQDCLNWGLGRHDLK